MLSRVIPKPTSRGLRTWPAQRFFEPQILRVFARTPSKLAASRAHLAKRSATGLNVRFLSVTIETGMGTSGTSPENWTSGYPLETSGSHKIPYDPQRDFTAVTSPVTTSLVLLINPSLPAHSVKDLIALVKAQPGKHSFASAGMGTPPHLTGELFRLSLGLDLAHLPYNSGGEVIGAVVGGHTTMCFAAVAPAVAH